METAAAHEGADGVAGTYKMIGNGRRRSPLVYAAALVTVPFLYLILVFALSSQPSVFYWLARRSYPALGAVGYGARLHGVNCQVVVYGDSTALTGIDPQVIESVTGLKTCNIAEGGWVPIVTGSERPLDVYLEHNSRPTVMLMMFSPALFRPYKEPFAGYGLEGMAYSAMFDRRPAVYEMMLRRPQWLTQFLIWMGNGLVFSVAHPRSHTPLPDTALERIESGGYLPMPYATETRCMRTDVPLTDPVERWASSVAKMRAEYEKRAEHLILDIAPAAACDVNRANYRQKSEALHDNEFTTYPIRFFNDGEVHYSRAGGRYLSMQLGNQILAALASQSGTSAGQPKRAAPIDK